MGDADCPPPGENSTNDGKTIHNRFNVCLGIVVFDKDNSMTLSMDACTEYLSKDFRSRKDLYNTPFVLPGEMVRMLKEIAPPLELKCVPSFFGLVLKGGNYPVELVTVDPKLQGISKGMHWTSGVVEVGDERRLQIRSSMDVPLLMKLSHVSIYNFAFSFNVHVPCGFNDSIHHLNQSGHYYFDLYRI